MAKNYFKIIDAGMLKRVVSYILEGGDSEEFGIIFKPVRVSMILETNRYQSLFLCELLGSYSIQSQRYCRFDGDVQDNTIISGEKYFSEDELSAIYNMIEDCRNLYLEMSELKEGCENKTKYTKDDFKYGIPIDDARFILPMVYTSNTEMTLNGEQFIKFYNLLLNENDSIFDDYVLFSLREQIMDICEIDGEKLEYIEYLITRNTISAKRVVSVEYMNSIVDERGDFIGQIPDVRLIKPRNNTEKAMVKSGAGALICTTYGKGVQEILESKSEEQFTKVTERVSGITKHTSISEHASFLFIMDCSVNCYNQFIRHRHQEATREEFDLDYIMNVSLPLVVPPSIINSETDFIGELVVLKEKYEDLIGRLYEKTISGASSELYNQSIKGRLNAIRQLLPMGYQVRVLWSTNLVNEIYKASKRTCNVAQWEIRDKTVAILDFIKKEIGEDNILLKDARPNCINGKGCREGKNMCKDNSNVKELFNVK